MGGSCLRCDELSVKVYRKPVARRFATHRLIREIVGRLLRWTKDGDAHDDRPVLLLSTCTKRALHLSHVLVAVSTDTICRKKDRPAR